MLTLQWTLDSTLKLFEVLLKVFEIYMAVGAAFAVLIQAGTAIRQWKRNQEWKAAEFLATEMKAFLNDTRVRDALQMVEWWKSEFAWANDGTVSSGAVSRALRYHEIPDESGDLKFTDEEKAIRDRFDALLDGLERFGHYENSKLVTEQDLRPYLQYWAELLLSYQPISGKSKKAQIDSLCQHLRIVTYAERYGFKGALGLLARMAAPGETEYLKKVKETYQTRLGDLQRDAGELETKCEISVNDPSESPPSV